VLFYRFGGRELPPLAASIDVDVFGKRFLAAYSEGDNREVVATDTMKNFVYAMAAEYGGRTLLGLCAFLGRRFIETYPVMEALRVSAREVPLDAAAGERGPSDVLFRSTRGDGAFAQVAVDEIERIFHEFNSRSIQHLVHEMGTRLLAAHTQLQEIEFVAENRTPDHVRDGASGTKVFAEPRATFGRIGLVLRR